MQCQYGRDRKGIDRYRKGREGRERLEQMSIPPTLPLPSLVVQKLFRPNEVSFGVDIGR